MMSQANPALLGRLRSIVDAAGRSSEGARGQMTVARSRCLIREAVLLRPSAADQRSVVRNRVTEAAHVISITTLRRPAAPH
jgi:hypothetical protein